MNFHKKNITFVKLSKIGVMQIKEITKGVYYCGVNDRVTQFFETLWPIENGVSYNSYIIAGEDKLALIDTVRIDEVREFLKKVETIAAGRNINYLVINHMEPDHSGSIPEVLRAYPDLKIVGNAQTISMIYGFYNINDADRFVEIKDGGSIDLGGRILKFFLTPMVHWPETMVTYLEEENMLFSGDAFGCFGALNGGVADFEMDTDWYFPEMYRYYTNIVGKYGKFVEKALGKLDGMPIDFICPTHGPVWHDRIKEVLDIYARLAAYKSEPGVTIIYGSMYGNTAEVAEMIARELAALGVKNIKVHNAAFASMSRMITDAFRYEGLIVGSATYSMRMFPPVESFLHAMVTREIKNKVFATFGSFTWAKNAVAAEFNKFSESLNLPIVASMTVKQTPYDSSVADARALAQAVVSAMNSNS